MRHRDAQAPAQKWGPAPNANEAPNFLLIIKESGFSNEQINRIFGPIGIKLGGKSAPEIALSIISQLVSEVYKK